MRWLRVAVMFVLFSCSRTETAPAVLNVDQMKLVMYDMIRVDEFATNYIAKDTAKDLAYERVVLYEKVFALHRTNKNQFYHSFKFYQKHPDLQKQLYDSLYNYSTRRRDKPVALDPLTK